MNGCLASDARLAMAGIPDPAPGTQSLPPRPSCLRSPSGRTAFTLLEVMIACGLFFMCVFAILAMVSSVLRNARSLRRVELDAGMVAAQVCRTNKLYRGDRVR